MKSTSPRPSPRLLAALIALALMSGMRTAQAEEQGPAEAPALQLRLVEPNDGADMNASTLLVKLAVQVPAGESLLALRALIDGRLAAQARGVKLVQVPADGQSAVTHLISVPIPPSDCTLSILAEGTRTKSAWVHARLRWRGDAGSSQTLRQPKLYVLSIGVSDYARAELRLRFAAKDARDLSEVFLAQQRGLYRSVEAKVLTNQKATKGDILDGLEWLQRQTTAKDVAVLFLAGHGMTDPGTGAYYFLPYDADLGAMKRTMVPDSDLRSTLANIAGKALLFIDTCHSGRLFDSARSRDGNDLSGFVSELAAAENGVVVFAASTGRQASQEAAEWDNGAFTRAVIEGLRGRADYQKKGRITLSMLDYYISERVKELTLGKQTPTTAKPTTVPDFPVAIVPEVNDEDVTVFR